MRSMIVKLQNHHHFDEIGLENGCGQFCNHPWMQSNDIDALSFLRSFEAASFAVVA